MIACPVYSAPLVEFITSLIPCLPQYSCKIHWHNGDSLVVRARNNIVHEFMQTKIPYLLFLDTDLVFTVDGFKHMMDLGPEYPIIGGCYARKKVGPPEWILNQLPGEKPNDDGLVKVNEVGTGLKRYHRSLFAAVREAYPQIRYRCDGNGDIRHDFFPVGTWKPANAPTGTEARYLSEDWFICQLARQIGYTIWADTNFSARHIGRVAFPFPDPGDPKAATGGPMPRIVEMVGEDPPKKTRKRRSK